MTESKLLIACREGDEVEVQKLLSQVEDPADVRRDWDWNKKTLLHYSCRHGWLDVTRKLVELYRCDPESGDWRHGITPLHEAFYARHVDIVRYFVSERGCRITYQLKSERNDTLLHEACRRGLVDMVKALTSGPPGTSTVSLNYQSIGNEMTALHEACRGGHVEVVRHLASQPGCIISCQNEDGDTPLHEACRQGHLAMVRALGIAHSLKAACDCKSLSCDTPLHLACRKGYVDIVRYLVSEQGCNTACQNSDGDTPLHEAFRQGGLLMVEILTRAQDCKAACSYKNKYRGDTPLHIACRMGLYVDVVRYLVSERGCNTTYQNNNGDTPLHEALRQSNIVIAEALIRALDCKAACNCKNKDGDTPLHMACRKCHIDMVRYLVSERGCITACQDNNGDTPLHEAFRQSNLAIAEALTRAHDCAVACNRTNKDGDIPLHLACRNGHVDMVRYLVSEHSSNTTCQNNGGDTPLREAFRQRNLSMVEAITSGWDCQNKGGNTPLHEACLWSQVHVDIVKYLVTELEWCPTHQNWNGDTPLHGACHEGHVDIVKFLVTEQGCSTACQNRSGDTPLHEACRKNRTDIVQFLLSTGKDPWHKNARNESPVELTDSYAISKLFAGLTKNLVTAVKVFIFGNPTTGKSTLVKVIESKVTSRFGALAGQFRKVSGVELKTAGINTVTIQDSRLGSVTIYDLAGQFEYYASHDALVENLTSSSTAIFIAVVKISDSEADVILTLQYWLSFIENCCTRMEATAHLMVVGSWKDKAKKAGENIDQKWLNIKKACISSTSSLHFVGFTALDCRKLASDGLDKICDMIGSSCATLRETAEQKEIIYPHLLHTFICTKLSSEVACSVRELCTHIRAEDDAFLPTEPNLLAPLLNSLSDGGHLLYLHSKKDFEAGWLVINKQVVLSEINGTVFAPENFKQHHDIATSTGVVPKSKIAGVFAEKYNIDMILGVLTRFEFCQKIKDSFTLSQIASSDPSRDVARDTTTIHKLSENYYFFPALVRVEQPTDVWQSSGSGQYQCGWCLKCSKEGQYLTPRFLHVLLLHLAFSFALAPERSQQDEASPVLRRRCAVWKNGIQWLDQDGIETIVEISEQNKLMLLLMSCPEGEEMACVRLRSSLISKLLETKKELCPRISTTELLIDPSNLSSYPLPSSSELTLYRMDDQVVKAVQEHKQFAIDTTGRRRMKLVKALHFEPCHGMHTTIVNQLFDKELVKQEADDSFLHDLAANIYPNLMEHTSIKNALKMFNIPDDRLFYNYCEQFPDERDNPIMRCFRLLLTWKNCDTGGGTYQSLRTTLDKYSIFCGRNPMMLSADSSVAMGENGDTQ